MAMSSRSVLHNAQCLLAKGLHRAASELIENYLAEHEAEPEILAMRTRICAPQARPSEVAPLLKRMPEPHGDESHTIRSSSTKATESPDAHPNPAASTSPPGTEEDYEWEFIETTATEHQHRRHYFRPEAVSTESSRRPDTLLPLGRISGEAAQRNKQPQGARFENETGLPSLSDVDGPIQDRPDFEFDNDGAEEETPLFENPLEGILDGMDPGEEGNEEEVEAEFETAIDFPAAEETVELDWEEFALEADEFDEVPTRDDLAQVQSSGKVKRWQRARQQAIELGQQFEWDEEGISVLTEVFDQYGWSQAKKSMHRELQGGMQPEELKLASALRDIWAGHPEFAMDFSRLKGPGLSQTTCTVYRNLSWPMALALVRSTEGNDDIEYLEHLLCELFDEWYTQLSLYRRLKSFNLFVFFRLGMAGRELQKWPQWTFEPDESLRLDSDEDYQPGFCTSEYRMLNQLGLLHR